MLLKRPCALRLLFLIFPLSMLASAASAVAQTTTSPVIFACVSNLTGVTRIVAASPGACHKGLETIVTWNQEGPAGPTGPTGSQGHAGVALPHVVLVPSGPDAIANGNNLAAAIASITDANVGNQYVVQMDTGYFKVPTLTVPAYVSIRGALTGSTTIGPAVVLACKTQPCTDSVSTLTLAGANTLAELSIQLVPVTLEGSAGTYTLHDVYGAMSSLTFSITDGQSIRIENSTLKMINGLNPDNSPVANLVAIGSQVGSFTLAPYSVAQFGIPVQGLHCLATFNDSYVPYTSTCQ